MIVSGISKEKLLSGETSSQMKMATTKKSALLKKNHADISFIYPAHPRHDDFQKTGQHIDHPAINQPLRQRLFLLKQETDAFSSDENEVTSQSCNALSLNFLTNI